MAATASAALATHKLIPALGVNITKPNILIFVFDAMSARNLSVYGYPRPTSPFLEQFARHATVFHAHYAGGNFTSPGTSTLLTGLYPWNHRAYTLGGLVDRRLAHNNLFQLMGDEYLRLGYAQNIWADLFLRQFRAGIDRHIPITSFAQEIENSTTGQQFSNDPIMAYYSIDEFLASSQHFVNPVPGSLTLGFYDIFKRSLGTKTAEQWSEYPYGRPFNGFYYYHNRTVFDGVHSILTDAMQQDRSVLAYLHLFSPHGPYTPLHEYTGNFAELEAPFKEMHPLSYSRIRPPKLEEYRLQYDEYISNVDAEFGRLINSMGERGLLENSYVIVTSDHGEVFERGEYGHASALLYDPIIHIPLLISAPGQTSRKDVYVPTSNADVVPTALHLAGKEVPPGLDGRVLPGFGGTEDANRSVFALEAKENSAFLPFSQATVAMIQGTNKLVYYHGYPKYKDIFEFYDLQDDIEEKRDRFATSGKIALDMKAELLDMLTAANTNIKNNTTSKE